MTTNTASGTLACPMYRIGGGGTVSHVGNYSKGQLTVQESTDENGHVSRTYTNKSGLVIMTEEGNGAADMFRTRRIYDDYGRLRYILPAAASTPPSASGPPPTPLPPTTLTLIPTSTPPPTPSNSPTLPAAK